MDIQPPKSLNVLVIGDSCVDIYHYGTCVRLSPEAPVPILKLSHTQQKQGMSLNVKKNLEAFDLKVTILTNQQVITKERFIDAKTKNHLLRFDTGENCRLVPFSLREAQQIEFDLYDAIAIVDYNKGFVETTATMFIAKKCHDYKIPLFVDSKKTNLSAYNHSIIKINALEASQVTSYPPHCDLIVTQGEKGASYQNTLYKSERVEVHDVCGAGDTFFAALIYKYLHTTSLPAAIKYANKCAKITVTKSGVYSLTKEDITNVDIC
ncbi:MAG: putative bifunctional protein HldE [Prokaryotic dsDNA virus sp.]|nr:MAG: putative bifunctional protein HldE [Prokaryotic dsDNA virus sp.]|tara:strand:- start:381 stop:1175 length:795 start_codon:yes stop_codon:yes gene_type:complete